MSKLVKKWAVTACFLSESRPDVTFVVDEKPSQEKLELVQELNKADWLEIHERLYPMVVINTHKS